MSAFSPGVQSPASCSGQAPKEEQVVFRQQECRGQGETQREVVLSLSTKSRVTLRSPGCNLAG